jgi:hypothetical protein
MNNPTPEDLEGLRKLFPELTEEELKEADERIERYPSLALEVYERIRKALVRYAELKTRLQRK